MKLILLIFLLTFFASCTNHAFDADMRQIAAKDEIASKIKRARGFNVLGFAQDTVKNYPDSMLGNPIQYTLNVVYKDSNNVEQNKTGRVLFTKDGNSIIRSIISNVEPK
ncbi:MAG: hypothetical protein NVSMB45_12380 [Ginsengibacter sp.]